MLIPYVSLTAKGGALFPVTQPIIFFFHTATGRAVSYCLAIVKNDLGINLNIIDLVLIRVPSWRSNLVRSGTQGKRQFHSSSLTEGTSVFSPRRYTPLPAKMDEMVWGAKK